jgi:alpha-1,3-fucosyltransferase
MKFESMKFFQSISIFLFATFFITYNWKGSSPVIDKRKEYNDFLNKVKRENDQIDKYFLARILSNSSSKPDCSPFKSKDVQYTVEIDNVAYPQYVPNYFNLSINFTCLNSNKKAKTILYWNKLYNDLDHYKYGLGKSKPFVENNCPVTNCEITHDRSRLDDADIVLVQVWRGGSHDPLPETRSNFNQRWAVFMVESPAYSNDLSSYNYFFNLSATYTYESDFASVYEYFSNILWKKNENFDESVDFTRGKDKFAAAVMSHCGDDYGRTEYIKKLAEYVPITIYGGCDKPCPVKFKNGKPGECKAIIASEFKFYLAFENSICRDYITEKFFIILNYNIIPVVRGGGDYSRFVSLIP